MIRKLAQFLFVLCVAALATSVFGQTKAQRPNVVLIYADDLGYGDVGCYGATDVNTPAIDRLAAEGLRFTDAHCPSATCTPSRYAMLTGEYAWRQKGTGIARGDAAAIIRPGRSTLASIFQNANYETGVVGKWHLGLGDGGIDWNGPIKPGPAEIGFDYHFLIPATGDRVPCVYVENNAVVGLDPNDPITVSFGKKVGNEPTGKDNPELLKMKFDHGHDRTIINGISRIGYMSGGKAARWVDEDMADVITEKAVRFIQDNSKSPFFLFFSLHDIHVPRVPHPRFVGTTKMGPRGDAIAQTDYCVGEILKTLDELGLTENTMVIFTSDNGPVLNDGYVDDAEEKVGSHQPAGPFRGGKYSAFEGGTRVPFIVRWPESVKPKTTSDALMCQIDFPASFAAMLGNDFDRSRAPDTQNHLTALLGQTHTGRTSLVEHSRALSLRQGNWKIIEPRKGPKVFSSTNIESGFSTHWQLYDLENDPGETRNLASMRPKKLATLQEELRSIKAIRGN